MRVEISMVKNNDIEEYLKNLELPRECDFCTFFSGNSIAPGVRPAWCGNPKSNFYLEKIKEEDTCKEGDFNV